MRQRMCCRRLSRAVTTIFLFLFAPANAETEAFRLIGQFGGPHELIEALFVAGDIAYVGSLLHGVRLLDVSNPASLTVIGVIPVPYPVVEIAVSGHHAYVGCGPPPKRSGMFDSFLVYDVSDPTAPRLVSICETPGYAGDITVADNLAYVACGQGGLLIIDVSDPVRPTVRGCFNPRSQAMVLDMGDLKNPEIHRFVYDPAASPGLPAAAQPIPGVDFFKIAARGVCLYENLAYVPYSNSASDEAGLWILDVNTPSSPTLKGNYPLPKYSVGGCISVARGYVCVGGDELHIIDVSYASSPTLCDTYRARGSFSSHTTSGSLVFSYSIRNGLQVWDVTEPANVLIRATFGINAHVAFLSGDRVFLAGDPEGLRILEYDDTASSPTPLRPPPPAKPPTPHIGW